MRDEIVRPFESIESALEFMVLLEGVIAESSAELEQTLEKATNERYGNGIRLALFKTRQLLSHVQKSRRILNDLTLLRGVLVTDATLRPNTGEGRG